MLKLSTSYSKKVPVEGQEFSSQSYHAAVELELSDAMKADEIRDRIHHTFTMVKTAVEDELNGTAKLATVQPDHGPANGNMRSSGRKISNAQAKFALDLSRRGGMKLADLDAMIREEYGANSVYELGAGEASALIEALKARKAA